MYFNILFILLGNSMKNNLEIVKIFLNMFSHTKLKKFSGNTLSVRNSQNKKTCLFFKFFFIKIKTIAAVSWTNEFIYSKEFLL